MGTGTGAGTETRAVTNTGAGTETRTALGRVEERQRRARNRKRVVDTMWETGEIWVEREKKRKQESVGSVAADPDVHENSKDAERKAQGTEGLRNNCTRRESVSPFSRLIRGFRNKYH